MPFVTSWLFVAMYTWRKFVIQVCYPGEVCVRRDSVSSGLSLVLKLNPIKWQALTNVYYLIESNAGTRCAVCLLPYITRAIKIPISSGSLMLTQWNTSFGFFRCSLCPGMMLSQPFTTRICRSCLTLIYDEWEGVFNRVQIIIQGFFLFKN